MEHCQIKEGIGKGDIVVDDKGERGKVGRSKSKDGGDVFNYNGNKPLSRKLKEHSKLITLHTSDGDKAHKKKLIDFVRDKIVAVTQRATGLIARDVVLEEIIRHKLMPTKDMHDLPYEVNQFIKTQITSCNNEHIKEEYGDAYEQLYLGKYHYVLIFDVRARDATSEGRVGYHNERRGDEFKDDREKESGIHDIIHMYYIWKDHSAIE